MLPIIRTAGVAAEVLRVLQGNISNRVLLWGCVGGMGGRLERVSTNWEGGDVLVLSIQASPQEPG